MNVKEKCENVKEIFMNVKEKFENVKEKFENVKGTLDKSKDGKFLIFFHLDLKKALSKI